MDTGLIDWLPRSHPNVQAFGSLFKNLEGVIHQEVIWLELDPDKAEKVGVNSISDPTSFRAQQELLEHIQNQVPHIKGYFGLLSLMKMARAVNTADGKLNNPESLPGTNFEMQLLWRGLSATSPDLIRSLQSSDPETPGTLLTFVIDAPPMSQVGHETAQGIQKALVSYIDKEKKYDLFRDEYLVTSGLSSGTASLNDTLKKDLLVLTPIAFLILVTILRLSLGSTRATIYVVIVMSLGLIWTIGTMGWLGTPLNVITFSLIPLILGCGVDYAILMAMDTLDHKRNGMSTEEALRSVRRTSSFPIFLTTLTTTVGLTLLVFNDSYGIQTLGLHATLGMLILAFLSTQVLPRLLVHLPATPPSRFGPIIAPIATSFTRNRTVVLVVVFVISIAAFVLAPKQRILLDVIEGNYPPNSPIAKVSNRILEKCGGAFPEIVIVEGDLARPEALKEIKEVQAALKASPELKNKFEIIAPTDILETFNKLKNPQGLLGAFLGQGEKKKALPENRDQVVQLAQEIHGQPHWDTFAGLFFTPEMNLGTLLLLSGDAGTEVESVGKVWNALERELSSRGTQTGIQYSFLGYRTMAYLFAEHSETWLYRTLMASVITVLLISLFVLRNWRYILVISVLVTIGGVWWLAFLHLAQVPMSIFLLFPLVFALCISSDYGLHMLCRLKADREKYGNQTVDEKPLAWTHQAWNTTGRAIAIAALTDGLIFLVFWKMVLESASQIMLAATLAVVAIFGCTIFLVPALAIPKQPLRPKDLTAKEEAAEAAEEASKESSRKEPDLPSTETSHPSSPLKP